MFPEYRDLIAKLKVEDTRFARLFDAHNKLDDKITGLTNNPVTGNLDELDELKREKLRLKDEMHVILKEAAEKEGK
ncbi:YdcH family protein [Snodgrassella sp. CFCC 13594]|uniref:YdcH family protein n=1 Tax=Snodgrassella sp. CFCC 13594 TaxID=1775559 RepID=UPI0008374C8D|nr:YdcH family protein [Snodgrassella sp. CFCC 13594]